MSLFSEEGTYDDVFLSNYADLYIVDALRRVKGVGNVVIFGERTYAVRLWLNPQRMASRSLTTQDVVDTLREQNIQVGAGQLGQPPVSKDQQYQIDLRAVSRFQSVEEFNDLIVKIGDQGELVKFSDIGRVELGAESYGTFLRYRGNESVGLGIFQLPAVMLWKWLGA
jgi:HAE1 family hydrophobic/amphiphilic exporter-1